MSGGASSAWTQAPAQWKATVSRPEADAAAGDPEVIRLIPSTIVTLESENGYRDGSSLQDVRRQLRAASRALGRAPRSTPASYALAPAGWLRTSWPKGVEHPAMSRRRNDSDVTGSLVALGDWVSSTIGEDLATLPAARVVFGVDFELAEKGLEVQTLLVFDTSARRVVHATTKFATNAWLLISQRWTDRVWEGIGLLNCHDLATVGQKRREPVTGAASMSVARRSCACSERRSRSCTCTSPTPSGTPRPGDETGPASSRGFAAAASPTRPPRASSPTVNRISERSTSPVASSTCAYCWSADRPAARAEGRRLRGPPTSLVDPSRPNVTSGLRVQRLEPPARLHLRVGR
jgi:hypothetical protein